MGCGPDFCSAEDDLVGKLKRCIPRARLLRISRACWCLRAKLSVAIRRRPAGCLGTLLPSPPPPAAALAARLSYPSRLWRPRGRAALPRRRRCGVQPLDEAAHELQKQLQRQNHQERVAATGANKRTSDTESIAHTAAPRNEKSAAAGEATGRTRLPLVERHGEFVLRGGPGAVRPGEGPRAEAAAAADGVGRELLLAEAVADGHERLDAGDEEGGRARSTRREKAPGRGDSQQQQAPVINAASKPRQQRDASLSALCATACAPCRARRGTGSC